MADEEFNICEYLASNDFMMHRLLSILRQTQNYCTNSECFHITRHSGQQQGSPASDFLVTCLIIAFVVLMYVFRPKSLRQLRNDNTKDQDNGRDSNGNPPAPPPAVN